MQKVRWYESPRFLLTAIVLIMIAAVLILSGVLGNRNPQGGSRASVAFVLDRHEGHATLSSLAATPSSLGTPSSLAADYTDAERFAARAGIAVIRTARRYPELSNAATFFISTVECYEASYVSERNGARWRARVARIDGVVYFAESNHFERHVFLLSDSGEFIERMADMYTPMYTGDYGGLNEKHRTPDALSNHFISSNVWLYLTCLLDYEFIPNSEYLLDVRRVEALMREYEETRDTDLLNLSDWVVTSGSNREKLTHYDENCSCYFCGMYVW
jgi:hypothetical protein